MLPKRELYTAGVAADDNILWALGAKLGFAHAPHKCLLLLHTVA